MRSDSPLVTSGSRSVLKKTKRKKMHKNENNSVALTDKETGRPHYKYIHKHKPTHNGLPIFSVGLWTVWIALFMHPFLRYKSLTDKNNKKKKINKSRCYKSLGTEPYGCVCSKEAHQNKFHQSDGLQVMVIILQLSLKAYVIPNTFRPNTKFTL